MYDRRRLLPFPDLCIHSYMRVWLPKTNSSAKILSLFFHDVVCGPWEVGGSSIEQRIIVHHHHHHYYFLTLSSAAWAYVVGAAEFGRERTFYESELSHLLS
jgi:hypothetical protein